MASDGARGDDERMSLTGPLPATAVLYAVTTTGIYCRPSCPSRPPKPENVRFFADAATAEAAGFRACKRCRPAARA